MFIFFKYVDIKYFKFLVFQKNKFDSLFQITKIYDLEPELLIYDYLYIRILSLVQLNSHFAILINHHILTS